jgi:hypothetical protein
MSDEPTEAAVEMLSDEGRWSAFDATLNRHLLWVYLPQLERSCLELTIASGYRSIIAGRAFPETNAISLFMGAEPR